MGAVTFSVREKTSDGLGDAPGDARALGDILVDRGVLTPQLLGDAIRRRRTDGRSLDGLLLADGSVSRNDLLSAFPEAWQLTAVDLMTEPPEPAVVAEFDRGMLLEERWVPLRRDDDGTMVVAIASRPDSALAGRVRDVVGSPVRLVATTDWDVSQALLGTVAPALVEQAANGLSASRPEFSADQGWADWQRNAAVGSVIAFVLALVFAPDVTLVATLIAINAMFLGGISFKVLAAVAGMRNLGRVERDRPAVSDVVHRIADADLPVFTVLVPVYHEASVLPDLVEHLRALDYPDDKLQVLVLLELDDTETIAAAHLLDAPRSVRFVVIPPGGPQTKPKACNVGLALAEGKYLVIYDAEDCPEAGQLREIVDRFADSAPDVVCIQARLNYFNARENILTRCFTLEYSFWFDYMLPGLDAWQLPIPLGGTSNHFATSALRYLRGWDPSNVTEDADLGLRAAATGLRVGVASSTTWEEACSQWRPWIRQRTRWIKGYMVTALVHSRKPKQFWQESGLRGVIGLVGLIMGTPAMFLAAPIVWGLWLFSFLGGSMSWLHLPHWVKTVTFANLVAGNLSMIVLSGLAARRRRAYDLIPYALLNPAYWVLHSIAAWRALYQLLRRPDLWEKTPHGLVNGPPGTGDAASVS